MRRHSGLQLEVLSLYRALLREATKKGNADIVKQTFRQRASWPKRDIQMIETWIRKGRKNLETLKSEDVKAIRTVKINRQD